MKYGVIDIGSNSVRLMISDGNNTLYKKVKTTRLAENMCGAVLQSAPMERTADAVSFFVKCAKEENVNEICVFATAAVRQAKNKQAFIDLVKDRAGIDVDVISGESEAQIGIKGALNGADGAIIDVGGASTEVIVTKDGTQIFSKSLNLGVVTLYNEFGQDKTKIENYISKKIKEFGVIPKSNFYGIGGTATSLASILQELDPYDPNKVDGYAIDVQTLIHLNDRLFSLSVEQRRELKGLQKERAEVIAGGCAVTLAILTMVGVDKITVSEKDNLEGYLMKRLENYE